MQQSGNLALRDFNIDFDTPLPQPPAPTQRYFPNLRSLWVYTYSAYDLQVPNTTACARRGCMIIVLVEQTLLSLLNVLEDATRARTISAVLGLSCAVIGFLHVSWCLAVIGELGDGRACCHGFLRRPHFDIFLFAIGVGYMVMLLAYSWGFCGPRLSLSLVLVWMWIFATARLAERSESGNVTSSSGVDEQDALV